MIKYNINSNYRLTKSHWKNIINLDAKLSNVIGEI